MLTLLTTISHQQNVKNAIASVDRLGELVAIVTINSDIQQPTKLVEVKNNIITKSLDWHDTEPPYIIPSETYTDENLLAIVFYSLGNYQKALEYISENSTLHQNIVIANHIQFEYPISKAQYHAIELSKHNQCIIHHYGNYVNRLQIDEVEKKYQEAIEAAENDELRIFTAKHYTNLLIDTQKFVKAETLIRSLHPTSISEEAKNALKVQLATVMMQQLQLPFEKETLATIQNLFQSSIEFYEKNQLKVNAGLLLIDASEIANYQQDFAGSNGYINKAIHYFKDEEVPEFYGEANLHKATLLYLWSKNGQPQYYKPAINAFQDTLKVFKRDTHPKKFADIHHKMALIYSEIPVSPEEKPIWTAFCASSFKEALAFYTKEDYPYENAMISHNYATALINFPEAKLHDNFDKAYNLFEAALEVRTANKYPSERVSTIINQLELFWLMHNNSDKEEIKRLDEMRNKINEAKALVPDAEMLKKITFHEVKLESLKAIL
ncbi:hypothetical protein DN752_01620 [Echinicola strongylocentroti]|uniref:Tetratricopeptide repeat protein n=1 Tax=Echinicola strongylocentroti TaxID=1795355 RepID=A0A2Z4ID56_9BACT|nr:hypothetical protein [Echinicola strongylocentroti]AWW28932.1 hypothetical protein DN752_01620 [Echinicola strongylocentroti]